MTRKPHYIPPIGGSTTGAIFKRQRIDLVGREWRSCVFDECTLLLYRDDYAPTTVITDCEFTNSTFAGDVATIDTLFDKAGH